MKISIKANALYSVHKPQRFIYILFDDQVYCYINIHKLDQSVLGYKINLYCPVGVHALTQQVKMK
jgi:hypothetical protein